MIYNPYNIYRAWISGKRPCLVSQKKKWSRLVWASSLKQCQKKFRGWYCKVIFPFPEKKNFVDKLGIS